MVVFYGAHRNGDPQESKLSAGLLLRGFLNAVIPAALFSPAHARAWAQHLGVVSCMYFKGWDPAA